MSSDAADVCYTPTGVYELLAKQVYVLTELFSRCISVVL